MRDVGDARTLSTMNRTRELAENGRLTRDQVRTLIVAKQSAPEHFEESEEILVGIALELPWISDLKKATEYWRQATESQEPHLSPKDQRDRSYLYVSQTFEGMVKIDGLLDAERGTIVAEAIRTATPPPIEGEFSTPASRRVMALTDLVSSSGNQPSKPTMLVHVDAPTLTGTSHTLAELGNYVLSPSELEQMTCDAKFRRIVFGPQSEIYDVGRIRRLMSEPARQALIARDRHCRFPGCDRPVHWCDAHHIIHWQHGGNTDAANCILLCRHHHTLIHQEGFSVEGTGHKPIFRRPDRTILHQTTRESRRTRTSGLAPPQLQAAG